MTTLSPPPGFGAPLQQLPDKSQLDKVMRSRDRRVSWAVGDKFCQIRLFAAEDSPALSGAVQEQLQAKPARNFHILNSVNPLPASDAPPGFGGVVTKPKPDPAGIAAVVPQIPWRPPSLMKLDPSWLVMAGGASKEVELQKLREVRVLEAVYPRLSSIPDSPAELLEPQESYDDASTVQIPLVPLEEEDLPTGSDMSSLSLGPRFSSQGSSGQVVGMQMVLPKASHIPDGRLENVKPYNGVNLPGTVQETIHVKDFPWTDSPALYTRRTSVGDRSSEPGHGRPHPLSNIHVTPHNNGVGPDVAAAATAALAVLSKSKEMGNMIDNELLIQILSDPGLIQSLTSKAPVTIANSKSELSSNIALKGVLKGLEKGNQEQTVNGTGSGNIWVSQLSTSRTSSGHEESRGRVGESYSNGGEIFQRIAGSDSRSLIYLPAARENGQQYPDSTNGRVGSSLVPIPPNSSGAPPGFGSTNPDPSIPPGFGSNSGSHQGSQLGARPLSRHDEQYFKSLIMQHGCKSADDDDHGRSGPDNQGSGGARPSNSYSANEAKRWYGREELEAASRPQKEGRDRRDSERNDMMGSASENGTRSKSRKACIYFGTSRGCRNGDNCMFVHEVSDSEKGRVERGRPAPTYLQYAKRLKVDG